MLGAVAPNLSQTTTYTRGIICSGTNANSNSGFVTSMTDALSRQTTYTYDCMGNVTSVTRLARTGNAVTTSFTYEPAFNQLTSITDPLGHQTTLNRDGFGNVTAVIDTLQHSITLGYNSEGQVTSITDGTGQNTAYIGNPLNKFFSSGAMSATTQNFNFHENLGGRGCGCNTSY